MEKKINIVGIIGRTNSGKSTLLNNILKKKISAVSNKVNTTRTPLNGWYQNQENSFLMFDSPGICQIRTNLDRLLWQNLLEIINISDVIWWVFAFNDRWEKDNQILATLLKENKKKVFFLINKIDLTNKEKLIKKVDSLRKKFDFTCVFPISAKKKTNFSNLIDQTLEIFKENKIKEKKPLTQNNFLEICKEVIREQIIWQTKEEIPHHTTLMINDFQIKNQKIIVYLDIIVARNSQKSIIIGKSADKIRNIRLNSQRILKKIWRKDCYLFINVKVVKDWYQNINFLQKLNLNWKWDK